MKNFLKKKEKNFKKESLHLRPDLFWKLAVSVMFLVTIFSAFWGYHLFMQTNEELIFDAGNEGSQIKTVKKEKIEKVLEYFSLREEKSKQILNSPSPVVDPSL